MTPKKAMELAHRAAQDFSQHDETKWLLGKCAAEWCEPYTRGRTDADFCKHLNKDSLSVTMVGDYRRVYLAFGANYHQWPSLKWTHFRAVLRLPEADQRAALDWAQAEGATCQAMVTRFRPGKPAPAGQEPSATSHPPATRHARMTALAQAFAACRNMRDFYPANFADRETTQAFAELLDRELEACEPAAGLN